ncbi:MAG TPA: hypothetical protein VNN80_08725 [Polyangiaceae bacterium]|jgi:hypothetical protein|nr:hypothetical protein [Polyangiaceae bacterium]
MSRNVVPRACALLLLAAAPLARAQQDAAAPSDAPQAATEDGVSFAAGVSFALLKVRELSDESRWAFIPSLMGLAYVPLAPRWYLRPGLRLGYAGLDQAQFSRGARLEEHDLSASAELAIQYDDWLVPSLGLGLGLDRREIDFVGRGIVQDSSAIDRSEWLGFVYAQAGLGVPLLDGLFVIEPYARLQRTFSDDRSLLQVGLDLSVGF